VTAYQESADGNISPALVIDGPRTGISKPGGLAVAPSGEVAITETNDKDAPSIRFYAPGASGNVAPIGAISCAGSGDSPEKVAFDSQSNLYAEYAGTGGDQIDIFTPSEQSGCNTISHVIFGSRTGGINAYGGITVARGTIYSAGGNGVLEFLTTDNGNVTPRVNLGGPNSGLASVNGVAVDNNGNLYVGNDIHYGAEIRIFSRSAHGDATPIAVISGDQTGLHFVRDVAVSLRDGRIFVAASSNNIDAIEILVFARGAHGNVSPIQVISGSRTGLSFIEQIGLRE
jgi:hypothetical protein